MATKDQLLSLLQDHPGDYLSGEEIAAMLGISRAAVCKGAKALRDQGIAIDASPRKGYRLTEDLDLISVPKITGKLTWDQWKLQHFSSLPSANSRLRELADQGAPEGTVLLCDSQTRGRGRMGRHFFSPPHTGLYLSLLLRPTDLSLSETLQLTTMAAAALCLAIEEATGKKPGIKWVNDLCLDKKKICGILTEASLSMETGNMESCVIGLGLNLCPPEDGFPEDIRNTAGVLLDRPCPGLKNRLTAGFLNHFSFFYQGRHFRQAAEIYRDRSLLPGKEILADGRKARVLDINDRCQLVVAYEDGTSASLSFGEVSIVNQNEIHG